MKLNQFISEIEAYYNTTYPKGQRKYIIQYLGQRSERALGPLFSAVLKSYSSRYGKAPDIEAFEKVRSLVLDDLDCAGQDLCRVAIGEEVGTLSDDEREQVVNIIEQARAKMSGGRNDGAICPRKASSERASNMA